MKHGILIFWIKTAFLFLYRSKRSTIALAMLVICAVSVLIFLASLAVGVNDTMISNSVSIYSGHIAGFNLPISLTPKDLLTDGVISVLKRAQFPGTILYERQIQTVILTGVDPVLERKHTVFWKKIVKGQYLRRGKKECIIGKSLAEKIGATLGNEICFRPTFGGNHLQLTIVGIFKTGIEDLDRITIFVPKSVLPVIKGKTWNAAIFLKKGIEPKNIISKYRQKLGPKFTFKSWEELFPDLKELIDLNYISMCIVMILVFALVAIGIACTLIIFIFKNLREYGIMRAMGVRNWEITFMITMVAFIMNTVSSFIGGVLGIVFVFLAYNIGIDLSEFTSHNRYFTISAVIYPRLTPFSVCLPLCLALFSGIVAAIWPVALILKKKPAEILRIT